MSSQPATVTAPAATATLPVLDVNQETAPITDETVKTIAKDFTNALLARCEIFANSSACARARLGQTTLVDSRQRVNPAPAFGAAILKKIIGEKSKRLARLRRHIRTVQLCDKLLPLTLCHSDEMFELDGVKYSIDDLEKSLDEFAEQEKAAEKKYGSYSIERFDEPQRYPELLRHGEIDNDEDASSSAGDSWSESSSTRSEIPQTYYSSRFYQDRPLIRSKSYPFLEAESDDWMLELGGGDSSECSDSEDASEDGSSSDESERSRVSMSIIERFVDPFAEIGGERQERIRLCRTFSLPDLRDVSLPSCACGSDTSDEELLTGEGEGGDSYCVEIEGQDKRSEEGATAAVAAGVY